jgi:hypothetical protein
MNTAPLQDNAVSDNRYATYQAHPVPVLAWAILYPIAEMASAFNRLSACPQDRIPIVPTNDGRFILYEIIQMCVLLNRLST